VTSSQPLKRGAAVVTILVVTAAFVAFPLVFSNPTTTSIAFFALVFMVSASAWNAFSGLSGYIALGHAVFFGCGAYALAIGAEKLHLAGGWTVFALVPLAGVVAGLIAVPFGLIALRSRRHTFVVITIAIFFIFQLLAFNLTITGGSSGLQTPIPLWTAVGYNQRFYYVALAILVGTVIVASCVRYSRFGLQLLAIRDDEDRARGLGVRTGRVKLLAFVVSAVPIGMVGAVYTYFLGQIFPQFAFDPLFDITVALMAFFGGLATITGPLLGALVLETMQQEFTLRFSAGSVYLVAYGALFLVVILLMPRGVVPTLVELVPRARWWWARRGGSSLTDGSEPGTVGGGA
jgi:branched-chain amino acid transport system permease protein